MSQAPAGWYDDGRGALRYWDGAAWTEHVHQPAAPAVPVAPVAPAAPKPRGGNVPAWVWWASGGLLALLLVAVVPLTIFTAMKPNPQRDARAAMEAYNSAWDNVDCAALWVVTTEEYRAASGIPTCDDFVRYEQEHYGQYDDTYRWIENVDVNGDAVTAKTWESFYSDTDYLEYVGTYTLTLEDGQWKVSSGSRDEQPGYDDES